MKTVNMHEAKTHLSRLVQEASAGEPFIIARSGKPLVKVVPINDEPGTNKPQRLGFLKGKLNVPPEFFDPARDEEVARMFYGEDES